MTRELLFEDFQVHNINLNIFDGTLRFDLIDGEKKERHKVFIGQISKIQCDISEYCCTVPVEEREWQLFDFSFRDEKEIEQEKKIRRKKKITLLSDTWIDIQSQEWEYNVAIEFGDNFYFLLKAALVCIDDDKYRLTD